MMGHDEIYRKNVQEQNVDVLATLCQNVAWNSTANHQQITTAQALRAEWVRLDVNRDAGPEFQEKSESLKKRMVEFLNALPPWMLNGP